jgi:hypothetical protein
MYTFMNKKIEINGKKIVYRLHGNGKPIMLVHGASPNPSEGGLRNAQGRLLEDSDREENLQLSTFRKSIFLILM